MTSYLYLYGNTILLFSFAGLYNTIFLPITCTTSERVLSARTSAISGEDFSGLWVYDDKGNNVMYIDTSVGDCDGLSTWSMQLDSGLVDGKQMGCILEIK